MKRSTQLDRYERFVGNDVLSHIYHAAAKAHGNHIEKDLRKFQTEAGAALEWERDECI